MGAEVVFVDTGALVALVNRSDALHARAVSIRDSLTVSRSLLLTSDWVLSEFLATSARFPIRRFAAGVVDAFRRSTTAQVVEADRSAWDTAFEFYRSREDKEWSHVDCTSILICQSRSISRVFTHDHHFAQAGLEVHLK